MTIPDHQELPPLPCPTYFIGEESLRKGMHPCYTNEQTLRQHAKGGVYRNGYSADQMRAYALQAFEAGKRSAPAAFHNVECNQCGARVQKAREDIQHDDVVVFGQHAAPAVSGEAVAYRTRYRSEPGMIGHYPWSYTERKPRFPNHEKTIEVEPLYAHPTGDVDEMMPHVGADEQGNATLEWWCGDRKITMYPMDGMLLKVWGPDCNSDMSEVRLEDADSVRAAFAWLTAAPKQEQTK